MGQQVRAVAKHGTKAKGKVSLMLVAFFLLLCVNFLLHEMQELKGSESRHIQRSKVSACKYSMLWLVMRPCIVYKAEVCNNLEDTAVEEKRGEISSSKTG